VKVLKIQNTQLKANDVEIIIIPLPRSNESGDSFIESKIVGGVNLSGHSEQLCRRD